MSETFNFLVAVRKLIGSLVLRVNKLPMVTTSEACRAIPRLVLCGHAPFGSYFDCVNTMRFRMSRFCLQNRFRILYCAVTHRSVVHWQLLRPRQQTSLESVERGKAERFRVLGAAARRLGSFLLFVNISEIIRRENLLLHH